MTRVYLSTVLTLEGWQNLTLLNGWTNTDTNYSIPQFYKDPFGVVRLRGQLGNGTASTCAQLPVGYRPPKTFSAITKTGVSWVVNIFADGNILSADFGAGAWVDLGMISFRAD